MTYNCVIFDLDGTLMDTSSGIIRAVDHISEIYQFPIISYAEKREFIGPPIQDSFQKHYCLTAERAWELASAWRDVYKEKFLFCAEPYEGIYALLERCRARGIKTGVATNKREDYTRRLLDHFGFTPLFDCVIGSDFEGKRSKTSIIQMCVEKIGENEPEGCLMIGDTMGDAVGAKEAGVDFLGVTYGFGFKRGQLEPGLEPIAMADNCKDIQLVLGLSE